MDHIFTRYVKKQGMLYAQIVIVAVCLCFFISILLLSKEENVEPGEPLSPNQQVGESYLKLLPKVHDSLNKISMNLHRLSQNMRLLRKMKFEGKQEEVMETLKKKTVEMVKQPEERGHFLQFDQDEVKCHGSIKLLILVFTKAQNFELRELIRKEVSNKTHVRTDKGLVAIRWRVFFVLGASSAGYIAQEGELKKDILQFNVMDVAVFERWKLMAALEWCDLSCLFDYVLVMNENMFLNIPAMYSFLRSEDKPRTNLYAGLVDFNKKVQKTGNFGVSRKVYPKRSYPRHAKMHTFLMSSDLLRKLVRSWDWHLEYPDRDAFIGEEVLKQGVDVWPVPKMIQTFGICTYENDGILSSNKSLGCLKYLYKESKNILVEL